MHTVAAERVLQRIMHRTTSALCQLPTKRYLAADKHVRDGLSAF